MLKPRNTLVAVAEIKEKEKITTAGIVVPSKTGREYKLCEIVAVGPGMATQPGERSLTSDLEVGQTVLVKLHVQRQIGPNAATLIPCGVEFTTDDGRPIVIVEQTDIVAVTKDASDKFIETPPYGVLPHDSVYDEKEGD